jgi:heptosyltransferase-2
LNRVLVIRGGAIGDFILTLPALRALREAYPNAHIEILGYKHIAALADQRFYANAVRSIEYGPLSTLFARNVGPVAELAEYFGQFDLVVSYLYDPDEIFSANLRRCGIKDFVQGPAKIGSSQHAAEQLVQPLRQLGIPATDLQPKVFQSVRDREFATEFLADLSPPFVAIHPGSGSDRKNWPLENWMEFGNKLGKRLGLIVVGGEADAAQIARLKQEWKHQNVRFAENVPLPQLAAILEKTTFVGHDSGISHLAAATGAHCVLLFGPTDPRIWAPLNDNVRVLRAPNGDLSRIRVDCVQKALAAAISPTSGVVDPGSPANEIADCAD